MTKPAERVAELDRQIAEIDAEISEFRKKAASVQANLEDKLSALRQKLQESDHLKQKLTREREAADAAAIEFLDVARELDKAETVEGLHKLGKLAATLAFAGSDADEVRGEATEHGQNEKGLAMAKCSGHRSLVGRGWPSAG